MRQRPAPHVDSGSATARRIRRLHLNESPFSASPVAIAAMQAAAAEAHLYPDHDPARLARALAGRAGVPDGHVVFGNGSSELLVAAAQVALQPGTEAIIPVPAFPLYAKAIAQQGADIVGVLTRADGAMDVAATLRAITPRTRIVFAATPNNPTGGLLSAADVETLAMGVPDSVLLLLDEAYYEFGRHAGGPDNMDILARRRGPWLVTRTFSKAHGLAGLRVGYGYAGTRELAVAINGWRPNFSLNRIAQAGALAALSDEAYVTAMLDANARVRDRLSDGLWALGFQPFPSATNFVTARTNCPAADVAALLQDDDILVMATSWAGTPNAIRISVGTDDDVDAVLSVLNRNLAARAA
jgi:histidinol-phosphate aminotransferase